MKKTTNRLLAIAVITGMVSCSKDQIGSGPVTTQTRTITGFTGIDLRMNGNVFYTNDTAWKVEVSAKQSIHPILKTDVVNGMLVIRYDDGKTYDADESIRIKVTGPALNRFELNTSGSISGENAIETANLRLRTSGSGSISLKEVTANNVDAASTQSGTISAAGGSINTATLNSDASGEINLSAIQAKQVTARTIGSGDISVKVSDRLDATVNGSGSIYFRGYPVLSSNVAGSGKIVRF